MKLYKLILLSTLFISALASCTSEEGDNNGNNPEILEAKTEFNVSYGTHAQQVYDIYLPAGRNAASTKTLLIIHGGGWTAGDKTDMNGIVALMQPVLPDYAIINMNYVLANGSSIPAFPNQLNDIESVLNKIEADKSMLQIDGTVALFGLSAGAHLSTLYGYTRNDDDRIKAVVNMVGPVDFTDPYYTNNPAFQLLLNSLVDSSAFPAGSNTAELVSPTLQVTPQSPPTINFYGNQDPLVAVSQLTRLEAALNSNNVVNESTIYNGGHGNWNATQYLDLQTKVKAFLESNY
ncbi:MAG: alpha/beta hydrolase fold domain-containing protein [Nonlabens sp.]|uniref:alpha/beta hydrolase fold domain-containing protein n=1 Tax=Nonlabens sp. TaxID=1888209 RepID=UPI003EF336C2